MLNFLKMIFKDVTYSTLSTIVMNTQFLKHKTHTIKLVSYTGFGFEQNGCNYCYLFRYRVYNYHDLINNYSLLVLSFLLQQLYGYTTCTGLSLTKFS